jgi:phosphotransferase system  glucose/maltose/N-acetylglucosamine-specific IIC component
MPRRLLNIASIVCLGVCVALMGMWMRSYYWSYQVFWRTSASYSVGFTSLSGRLVICDCNVAPFGWEKATQFPCLDWRVSDTSTIQQSPDAQFHIFSDTTGSGFMVPFWLPVLLSALSAGLATIPWIRRPYRFSLRTLLIATTLLAVVLGMIAWLDRSWIGK